jgi:hypothetical protein
VAPAALRNRISIPVPPAFTCSAGSTPEPRRLGTRPQGHEGVPIPSGQRAHHVECSC